MTADPQDELTYWRDQARHWQAKAEQLDAEVLKANESAQRIHNLLSSLCVSHAPSAEHQIDERIRGLAWARERGELRGRLATCKEAHAALIRNYSDVMDEKNALVMRLKEQP